MKKRGFTLIEMLIVVALIATLMTIVFRLSSVSSKEEKRTETVLKLSQLENCLSGYYAAFGNYPPVKLHNTRDIYQEADGHGVQSTGDSNENLWNWSKIGEADEQKAWYQVKAACQAQPVGAEFPYPKNDDMKDRIAQTVKQLKENTSSGKFKNYPQPGTKEYEAIMAGFDGLQENLGRFSNGRTAISWRDIQIFKFGLMSFLLPRYQMMMAGNPTLYTAFAQWTSNNVTLSNPLNGQKYTWDELNDLNTKVLDGTATAQDLAELSNIPSDVSCVRWLPNLSGICTGTREMEYYGVTVADDDDGGIFHVSLDEESSPPSINIYSPSGDSNRDQYVLDNVTVLDGWLNEFYYYSPSPHQSYQLWSSGANGRTFPPWVSRAKLSSKASECVAKWTQDDIRGMSK